MAEAYPRGFYVTPQFEQHRQRIADNALEVIIPWTQTLRRDEASLSSTDFLGSCETRYFDVPDYVVLRDGVVVRWCTQAFLEDRAHCLVFTADGGITYNRQSYNEDCQKVGSPTLDLVGYEEVTTHNEPVIGMLYASSLLVRQPGDL